MPFPWTDLVCTLPLERTATHPHLGTANGFMLLWLLFNAAIDLIAATARIQDYKPSASAQQA